MSDERTHYLKAGKRDVMIVDREEDLIVGTVRFNVFGDPSAHFGGGMFTPKALRMLATDMEEWAVHRKEMKS